MLSNSIPSPVERLCQFHFPLTVATLLPENVPADGGGADQSLGLSCWNLLPSSLEQKSSLTAGLKNSAPKTEASVIYQVQVELRLGTTVLASVIQKVHIFDCQETTPPLCLRDFVPEYTCQQDSIIRKNILKRIGTMSVEATQPEPLVFVSSGGWARTKILLRVSLYTTSNALRVFDVGAFDAAITWRLRSSTFVSMQMSLALPTVRQVSFSPLVARLVTSGPLRRLKMIWSDWTRASPQNQPCSGTKIEWTATYPIWLSIQSSSALAPTFSLPYLSRRYSILLHVNFSGPGQSQASLNIPVQLTYQSTAPDLACLVEARRSPLTVYHIVSPFQALPEGENVPLPPYIA